MWIRQKKFVNSWGSWEWFQELSNESLIAARNAVKAQFKRYIETCVQRGELLYASEDDNIKVPLGFTPNDFIRTVVTEHPDSAGIKVDFFNIRCFFQTIQIAPGSYDEGPQKPFKRLTNVLTSTQA